MHGLLDWDRETRRFLPRITPAAVGCNGLSDRGPWGMIEHHTITNMPKTKVAVTVDAVLLERVDELVAKRRFVNRSQAVETALAEKIERLARTRLARECTKLDPREEKALAEEGLAGSLDTWPEY